MSLNTPPVDKLIELAGNKYALSVLVSKRAKEISVSRAEYFNEHSNIRPVSVASEEFFKGIIKNPTTTK